MFYQNILIILHSNQNTTYITIRLYTHNHTVINTIITHTIIFLIYLKIFNKTSIPIFNDRYINIHKYEHINNIVYRRIRANKTPMSGLYINVGKYTMLIFSFVYGQNKAIHYYVFI